MRRPLYHLPEAVDAVEHGLNVFIVEGEKDVDRLRRLGFIATCNPHGAGKWLSEHTETPQGANVCVITDQDEPGRKHARHVVKSLTGVANMVLLAEPIVGKDVIVARVPGGSARDPRRSWCTHDIGHRTVHPWHLNRTRRRRPLGRSFSFASGFARPA